MDSNKQNKKMCIIGKALLKKAWTKDCKCI